MSQIEFGYCQCGCGNKTGIANNDDKRDNVIKGQPYRFIRGHHGRVTSDATRKKLSDAITRRRIPNEIRFWELVDKKSKDECWEWQGVINEHGYGVFYISAVIGYGHILAHRYSYSLANGDFDKKLKCLHRCDNPPCVNPNHLFTGTPKDNTDDMVRKGRTYSKFTEKDILEIRELKRQGYTAPQIAKMKGTTDSNVYMITSYGSWKHVK